MAATAGCLATTTGSGCFSAAACGSGSACFTVRLGFVLEEFGDGCVGAGTVGGTAVSEDSLLVADGTDLGAGVFSVGDGVGREDGRFSVESGRFSPT